VQPIHPSKTVYTSISHSEEWTEEVTQLALFPILMWWKLAAGLSRGPFRRDLPFHLSILCTRRHTDKKAHRATNLSL